MDDFDDHADLDGDGEFDGIDIDFLEGEGEIDGKQPGGQNTGCCLPVFIAGFSITSALFSVVKIFTC